METHETAPRCNACASAREEQWTNGKEALRCWAPGERRGYVTDIYPEGKRSTLARRDAPAWCPGFTPEK